jgi:nicotinamidase-related amidase
MTGSTALLVVDAHSGFADPKGSLCVGEGEWIVPLVNREIERALGAGALAVYTQDWHPARTAHFRSGGGVWPGTPGEPCSRPQVKIRRHACWLPVVSVLGGGAAAPG